jgi:hypothetical protein
MKTLVHLFAVAMLLFAGCAKDEMFETDSNSPDLKNAKVPIPMKADLCAVPDMTSDMIPFPGIPDKYVPSKMIISGNGTHIGKVNAEKSFYKIDVFEIIMEEGVPFLFQSGTGYISAANGDSFDYTWWAKASLPDMNYIGEIELQGGTGIFNGCSGTLDMSGKINTETLLNSFTVEGKMKFN